MPNVLGDTIGKLRKHFTISYVLGDTRKAEETVSLIKCLGGQ